MEYSKAEKLFLWALAAVGVVALNTVFIYCLVTNPSLILETLKNPIALVFIIESFLLMGALAYFLTKWKVARLNWKWFIALSLLGSIAFALPLVLLWPTQDRKS